MRIASFVASLALTAVAGSACVTRTVYVVDDNPRNDPPPRVATRAAPAPQRDDFRADAVEPEPQAMPYEQSAGITSESDFYEPLSPYGDWVYYPGYGRVFVPASSVVGAGFRPYTYGHWEQSEWGWTWVDHHPFGWATGHYGRWFYDGTYGWVWVPGTTWAPAWVSWRSGGGYVGWAALPPGAELGGAYTIYDTSWVFVSYGSMGYPYIGTAIVVGPGYRTCYYETYPSRDTVVVYGRTYYRGPDENEVVRDGGHVVHRPAREADNDHPVTRPPSGTTRPRPGSSDIGSPITSGRDRHDSGSPSAGSRPRDDGAGGGGGPHDGGARGSNDGPDRRGDSPIGYPNNGDRNDVGGRNGDARADDGHGGPANSGARDQNGHVAGDDGRPDTRSDRGVRDSGHVLDDIDPNRGPTAVDVTPREDPAASGSMDTNPRDPSRSPNPYAPIGGTRGSNTGTNNGGATVGPRPIDPRDDDSRIPYNDITRPTKQNPEDPDRFRGITGRPTVNPGFPTARPPVAGPDRGPGTMSGPPTRGGPSMNGPRPQPPAVSQPQPEPEQPGQPTNGKKKKSSSSSSTPAPAPTKKKSSTSPSPH